MERWTYHRYASNPHRVVNLSGSERCSMAPFFDPDFDTAIQRIDTCTGSDDPSRLPFDRREMLVRLGTSE